MTSRHLLSLLMILPTLFLLPSCVMGHAKLVSPAAWNPNPSKTQVCGVPAGQNNPANFKVTTVNPNKVLSVQWTVVIGDGAGALTASIDPTAKINPATRDFSVQLDPVAPIIIPSAVSPTPYTVNFQIPVNTVCTGPGGTCTLRVISTSNWVACATITLGAPTTRPPTNPPTNAPTIPPTTQAPTNAPTNAPTSSNQPTGATTATPTPPTPTTPAATIPPPPPVAADNFVPYPSSANPCVIATGLVTCSTVNGQNIQLMGPSLTVLDANVQDQVNSAVNNPAVLTTPDVQGCQQAFTDLICAQSFPPCSSTTPSICTSTCERVNNLCSPNATLYADGTSHASLYACGNTNLGFTATVSDTTGYCPNVQTGIRPSGTTPSPTPTPRNTNHAMVIREPIMMFVTLTMVLAWIAQL